MKTSDYFRCGFRINSTVEATVRCIKHDRVCFSVVNIFGRRHTAWFYIHGEHINPYQIFNIGDVLNVRILRISKDNRKEEKILEVRPEILPIDTFLENNPVGSTLQGTVEKVEGSGMLIRLAENVFCMVKRIKHAHTGMRITCKLSRYNANRKVLFATVL